MRGLGQNVMNELQDSGVEYSEMGRRTNVPDEGRGGRPASCSE
jgi:hypothetical protein